MKIAILGGIGPDATGYFYSTLIKKLKKSGTIFCNADYPQIIINSINAPELTSLTLNQKMIDPYIVGIKELVLHKPDFIVMACNTIHLFRDELIKKSGFKNILSIKDIVEKELSSGSCAISILATPETVKSGLYSYQNQTYVNPDIQDLQIIGKIVNDYNSTGNIEKNKEKLLTIIKKQKQLGINTFLAGCTEISELLKGETNLELLDTLEILIDYVLSLCLNNKSRLP